ncbi:MAG: hypothetical protein Q9227_001164 [Pyrenula ochraceoflavens]
MSEESNGTLTPEPVEHFAIGISFGNSNSSIAYVSGEGKAEVIANQEGDRQIPSVLSYVEGEEFHGTQAKSQLVRNSKNTVAYFRDFLGKDFKAIDPTPCHASARPIEHDSSVAFSVRDTESDSSNTISASVITTRHLRRLAQSASDFLGRKVNAAVISIPTDFQDAQKEALTKAALKAELEVLQLIPEPISAAVAYDARSTEETKDKTILVADLGGIRSDVAVVASRGGTYTTLATAHDYELGGAQLDQVLIDFFAKEFMKKNKTDPRTNERSLAKLKLEAEAVKKALSLSTSATLSVESLADGIDYNHTINRSRYDIIASKVFSRFVSLIQSTVQKADLDVLDIDEIILSGGTSHTPKIASSLAAIFPSSTTILSPSTFSTAINPAHLSARGAAIQASLVQEFDKDDIDQSTHPMLTVTPHLSKAIGVLLISQPHQDSSEDQKEKDNDVDQEVFEPLIYPETPIPARRNARFSAPKDGGDVVVRLCEGERTIKVTKPEPKPKTIKADGANEDDAEEDLDSDDEDEDEEDIRQKVWKSTSVLAEVVLKDVKKRASVEVMVNVFADLGLEITAREVGGKGGVRGKIEGKGPVENGKA